MQKQQQSNCNHNNNNNTKNNFKGKEINQLHLQQLLSILMAYQMVGWQKALIKS